MPFVNKSSAAYCGTLRGGAEIPVTPQKSPEATAGLSPGLTPAQKEGTPDSGKALPGEVPVQATSHRGLLGDMLIMWLDLF